MTTRHEEVRKPKLLVFMQVVEAIGAVLSTVVLIPLLILLSPLVLLDWWGVKRDTLEREHRQRKLGLR